MKKELKTETFGKCITFSAIPGRGLKAMVSKTEIDGLFAESSNNDIFEYVKPEFELDYEEVLKDTGKKNEYEVLIGNRNLIEEEYNISISLECENIMKNYELMGYTSAVCAING